MQWDGKTPIPIETSDDRAMGRAMHNPVGQSIAAWLLYLALYVVAIEPFYEYLMNEGWFHEWLTPLLWIARSDTLMIESLPAFLGWFESSLWPILAWPIIVIVVVN
jgi:hypothetical protein